MPVVHEESDIHIQPHTTPSQCRMHNHDNIQHTKNQTESKQIPSPQHVVTIPLDIEDNISLDDNNFTTNSEQDDKPDYGPFMATSGINLDIDSHNPENFINNIFDNRMFTIIADATNEYAQRKIRSILGNRDHFQQIEHHSHR